MCVVVCGPVELCVCVHRVWVYMSCTMNVCTCMYVKLHVCLMYVCMYVHSCMYMYVHVCTVHVGNVCIYAHTCSMYVHVHMYVYMYVHVCVHV